MDLNRKFSDDILPPKLIFKHFNIEDEATVIDAACGSGYMAKAFAQRLLPTGGKAYALDIDEVYIDYFKDEELSPNLEPVLADISKKTKFADESIDLLYISGAYHIFDKNQEKGFDTEVARILKPKGKLIVVNFKKIKPTFGPGIQTRSSPQELEKKISLKPFELIDLSEYFYMYIFIKD